MLKQHWDGNELPFVPESALDFFSKSAPLFSLSFARNANGKVTQALAFKRDLWIKTEKANLSPEKLKTFEGKFRFKDDPDNLIQVIAKDNYLIVKQLWDNKETSVYPQTDSYFYNDQLSYPLQLIFDEKGLVKQVIILGDDRFDPIK